MAVGWTVAATAGANRRTPRIPVPSNQLSGPAPLFNLLLNQCPPDLGYGLSVIGYFPSTVVRSP
jgi:hypothetical protein